METVVGCRFLRPAAPLMVCLHDVLLRVGNDEVYDHGGAANQASRGACEKILGGNGSHERQFHVCMRINAAGHDVAAACIDYTSVTAPLQVAADSADHAVIAQHVGVIRMLCRDYRTAFYQYGHIITLVETELILSPSPHPAYRHSSRFRLRQYLIGFRPAIAQELPAVAHLAHHVKVNFVYQ